MYVLRRILNPMGTQDAIEFLLDKLKQTKGNAEFFNSMNTYQFVCSLSSPGLTGRSSNPGASDWGIYALAGMTNSTQARQGRQNALPLC